MRAIHIIYASTSGHTEYVVDALVPFLEKAGMTVEKQRAEFAKQEDVERGDLLILASSTWNTGNVEGQLNPHMYVLLAERAKDAVLQGKNVALIALGDERYHYTANAAVHLEEFIKSHGGTCIISTLKIINEPYGQESKIEEWGRGLVEGLMGESGSMNHESRKSSSHDS